MDRSIVVPLSLGSIVLPDWHPWADSQECVIQGFALRHPDGVILVDTGVGTGNEFIDHAYRPRVIPLEVALNTAGLDEREVVAIVNTHLHFDHCGQNSRLPHATVHVQRSEVEAAAAEFYTVPEWAAIDPARLRMVDGDELLAPGVTLLATPGHTPGHQSVLIDAADSESGPTLIVGQACFTCGQFEDGAIIDGDLHDASWRTTANESLERLRARSAAVAHFSHDASIWHATT